MCLNTKEKSRLDTVDKKELNDIIREEKDLYITSSYSYMKYTHARMYMIWKLLANYRRLQYYREKSRNIKGLSKLFVNLKLRYYARKKNIFSEKCGIEIANDRKIGRRLRLWHGGVVINANLGDDCAIHGNNILGNKGEKFSSKVPNLGNGVDVGVGAIIIGGIDIADNCVVGANAVVTKNFDIPGSIIIGIPGRLLEKG